MTDVKEFTVRHLSGRAARRDTDRAVSRHHLAWTAAGLVLVALVLVLRVVFPPPALAEAEQRGGAAAVVRPSAPLPVTAAEAARAQQAAAEAAARAVGPRAPAGGAGSGGPDAGGGVTGANPARASTPALAIRPDYVSELEWQALRGVAAQSRDPQRTLAALVDKLRFSKQLELFRSGDVAVPRAGLAAQLLADLPARVAAGDMARDEALRLLPSLVEPLEPDPGSRALRVRREAERLPGRVLQALP